METKKTNPETVTPEELLRLAKSYAQSQQFHLSRKAFSLAKRLVLSKKFQPGEKPAIRIYSSSDEAQDEFQKLLWGDYWVQYELTRCLGLRGYPVSKRDPQIIIHLFGFPVQLPNTTYNIAWIYSHPDLVTPERIMQYDQIFTLSASFQKKLAELGFASEVMLGATAKQPFPAPKITYPAVFVGNARRGGLSSRPAVEQIKQSGYPFLVWGNGWESYLPPERIGGLYYDNQRLDHLYASSEFSINDHHADMSRYGFVAVKIFDILASGGFAVSDVNPGIEAVFGNTVPQFQTAEDLRSIFSAYALGKSEREALRKPGQAIALSHTWEHRADTFLQHICTALDPQNIVSDIGELLK